MKAKELKIEKWLNTSEDYKLDLEDGSIKVIHFFQMLCPGCVYYGIPQTTEVFKKYQGKNVKVLGVHSVFEHHEVMTQEALKVFIHEWRLPFPVGIDQREEGKWLPETMGLYQLQGTPTTVIIDGNGELRMKHFGHMDQDRLEVFIDNLLLEESSNVADNKRGVI